MADDVRSAEEVDVEFLADERIADFFHIAEPAVSGVVDDDVERAEFGDGFGQRVTDGVFVVRMSVSRGKNRSLSRPAARARLASLRVVAATRSLFRGDRRVSSSPKPREAPVMNQTFLSVGRAFSMGVSLQGWEVEGFFLKACNVIRLLSGGFCCASCLFFRTGGHAGRQTGCTGARHGRRTASRAGMRRCRGVRRRWGRRWPGADRAAGDGGFRRCSRRWTCSRSSVRRGSGRGSRAEPEFRLFEVVFVQVQVSDGMDDVAGVRGRIAGRSGGSGNAVEAVL